MKFRTPRPEDPRIEAALKNWLEYCRVFYCMTVLSEANKKAVKDKWYKNPKNTDIDYWFDYKIL